MRRWSRFKVWFWPRPASSEGREGRIARLVVFAVTLCSCALLNGAASPIILTDQHRSVSVPIDARDLAAAPPVLEIEVTDVWNPDLVPLGVAVWIVEGDERVPVGNFAFYPPDKKGTFHLSGKEAFARVKRHGSARLLFELQKLRPSADWKPVRVSLSQPRWLGK